MKTKCIWPVLVAAVFLIGAAGPAFSKDSLNWEQEFVDALKKGKEAIETQGEGLGLGYTPSEATVLEEAIQNALDQDAPPCECMKIAVGFDYNPYNVLTSIYGSGKGVELDNVCMCATEEGVMKEVIARAASDAVNPVGEKVFDRDEITQSQCLQVGLPYTAAAAALPDSPEPPSVASSSDSVSSP